MSLKLEVGKTYLNREGKIVSLTKIGSNVKYPFMCSEGFVYTPQGRSHENHECYLDLVSEYRPDDHMPTTNSPSSEVLYPGIDQIPFEGMIAIGEIFNEGESKYGRDNWKKQPDNIPYEQERTRHAIGHLMLWANGDRSENHLAKVAWFCVTQLWREKQREPKND